MRILIIDDQIGNANHLKRALEKWGFEVQMAATGEQGVRIACQFLPSLVLCHLALPDMDGYAVARTLQRHPALIQTRFIARTGSGSEPDHSHLQKADFETGLSDACLFRSPDSLRWEREMASDSLAKALHSQVHDRGLAFPYVDRDQVDQKSLTLSLPGEMGGALKSTKSKPMGPSILIVEPRATSRSILGRILEREGYEVLEAEDALTALKLFIRDFPQMVLQNLMLPDMDGCGLAQWVRLLPGASAVPILAISDKPFLLEQARSRNAGLNGFLCRPCLPSHILQTIHGFLPARGFPNDYPPHLWKTRTSSPVVSPTSFASQARLGGRILVVEPNKFQSQELVNHLVELGFDVSLLRDGREALDQALAILPDIVIVDPVVPNLDGFEFCLEIKKDQHLASIPVILTPLGVVTEVDVELAQEIGAAGYVGRTPDFRELDALLKTTLIKKSGDL